MCIRNTPDQTILQNVCKTLMERWEFSFKRFKFIIFPMPKLPPKHKLFRGCIEERQGPGPEKFVRHKWPCMMFRLKLMLLWLGWMITTPWCYANQCVYEQRPFRSHNPFLFRLGWPTIWLTMINIHKRNCMYTHILYIRGILQYLWCKNIHPRPWQQALQTNMSVLGVISHGHAVAYMKASESLGNLILFIL